VFSLLWCQLRTESLTLEDQSQVEILQMIEKLALWPLTETFFNFDSELVEGFGFIFLNASFTKDGIALDSFPIEVSL